MPSITPVIMSGGSGTRLWPLSRHADPKQYRPLVSDRTMLEETAVRVTQAGADVKRPVVICSEAHCGRITSLLAEMGGPSAVITEPVGRNTAPVAIVASLHVAQDDPEGMVLLLPADHFVRDVEGFWQAVRRGEEAARRGHLVTLGIKPTAPESGYGYIKRGAPLTEGVYEVEAFREKPDVETAKSYLEDGSYAWNAGIFLFRARDLLEEAQRFVPEMMAEVRKAYDRAVQDGTTLRLDEASFAQVPADSIDYAIMERTERAAIVHPVDVGWDDIGSWSAVASLARGADSVAAKGDVVTIDCEDTYVRSEGPLVAAVGLKGVIVVAMDDAVLVIDESRSQDVKAIIEQLKAGDRSALL
ncbi:mannose-1-phosphate guanylyltransferase/mannose-6-phosphate isomerase [Parvularcula dongshanensis]|uniref:mannose-1-phosphate guanylyltransferase n=1 Tax=Parvularcula dongshanensis TaxID=1173995 RepID=A0A840I404_9PROT|nr:mannose-1-phosphate guanylyltransferase/mannose-6-phosphate isomerase [Parvularcula dongshanensis]MBB4658770.1 mannose-1-phosphate guanylyltransferase/mannose-6-phosphate isomerase [Parvularcula dongshanensis]